MDDLEGQLEALREPVGTLLPSEVDAQRIGRRRKVLRLLGAAVIPVVVAVCLLLL